MATTDYTGRTVDLLVMQGLKESGQTLVNTTLGEADGGYVTTGVQKAVQFFTVWLLTEAGTVKADSLIGTRFLIKLRQSNLLESQLQSAFRESVETILDAQQEYVTATTPDDEVLVGASLISFTTTSFGNIKLTVALTTRAGITRTVIMPVTVAIR